MEEKKFSNKQEFETFILSVIRQIAAKNGQIIQSSNSVDFNSTNQTIDNTMKDRHIYDAIAPYGFENINSPVVFEIKFSAKASLNLKNTLNPFKNLYKNTHLILITNTIINEEVGIYEKEYPNVIVWDKNIVDQWIVEYPVDYNNAISLKVVKEPALSLSLSDEDFSLKSKNNTTVMKKIIEANETFALVLGAGVSCDLGAKDWNNLLNNFKEKLLNEQSLQNPEDVCKRIGDTLLITAELCKDLYKNEKDFYWDIHNGIYSNPQPRGNRHEIDSIVRIILKCREGRNFRVLTYNYDDFLEKSLDEINVPYSVIYNQFCMPGKKLPIYHAHGFFPQVNKKGDMQDIYCKSIVLTESNYNDLYNHPYDWTIACQLSFFRENTCLFIGSSLSDPNIRRLLQISKTNDKVHYAIMAKRKTLPKDLSVISNHFLKMGVEIIWVEDYPDIVDVLEELII